jgi:hypothetical protein
VKYYLQETDFILINGAIALGDTLKTMPEASAKDVLNIEKLQEVLRRLPEYTPNLSADYRFSVINITDINFRGINRGWGVYINPNANGLIEIASHYTILPDRDEDLEHDKEFYFTFILDDGWDYDPKYFLEWIEEVKDPNQYRNPEQEFEIITHFEIINR